jgi:hypothetical protein
MTNQQQPVATRRQTTDRDYIVFAVRIMADFGLALALPAVAFAEAGKWADARYGTRPWLLIASLAIAALVSGTYIYRKAKAFGAEYGAMGRAEPKPNDMNDSHQ